MRGNLFLFLGFTLGTTLGGRHLLEEGRSFKWAVADDPNEGPSNAQPEQIHISHTGSRTSLFVTWLLFDDVGGARVEWGLGRLNQYTKAQAYLFRDGQNGSVDRYIYRATLEGLQPGRTYMYRVGSDYGWSAMFHFNSLQERPDGDFVMAVFGDMGHENARSLGKLQGMAQKGALDMIFHIGDFAYDMEEKNSQTGDVFMRQIQAAAAYVPYMTAVGNHDSNQNFTQYVNRFTMPGTTDNHYYSFDLGLVHYIVFSTEFYFYTQWGTAQIGNQWNWLADDLKKANANRKNVPWVITMGHRPMYCSNFDGDDCTKYEGIIRTGMPDTHEYGLEDLFYEQGVDVAFWAHEHSYERLWPVYNRTVYNKAADPYVDPPSPVHITTGSAGCREIHDIYLLPPPPWTAKRTLNYGFGVMQAFNTTHLRFQQVAAVKSENDDDLWVIRNKHGPFTGEDRERLLKYGTYIPTEYCHHPTHCKTTLKQQPDL